MTLSIIDKRTYDMFVRIIGYLEKHNDKGLAHGGWQSDELIEAIAYLRAMLGK